MNYSAKTNRYKQNTNEIIFDIGTEITPEVLSKAKDDDSNILSVVDTDPINKGPYMINTLVADKNANKEDALSDIYRVLRPGEPPTP